MSGAKYQPQKRSFFSQVSSRAADLQSGSDVSLFARLRAPRPVTISTLDSKSRPFDQEVTTVEVSRRSALSQSRPDRPASTQLLS